jgi:hypothetical protein
LQKERINKRTQGKYFLKKKRLRRGSAQRSPSVVPFLTGGERNEILTLVPEADERGLARTGPLYRVRGSVQESTGGGLSHASARDCMQNHAGQVSRTVPGGASAMGTTAFCSLAVRCVGSPPVDDGSCSSPRRHYCTALLSGGNLGTVLMYYSSCYQMRQWELTLQLAVPAISGHQSCWHHCPFLRRKPDHITGAANQITTVSEPGILW